MERFNESNKNTDGMIHDAKEHELAAQKALDDIMKREVIVQSLMDDIIRREQAAHIL
jgi:hypothetical protein